MSIVKNYRILHQYSIRRILRSELSIQKSSALGLNYSERTKLSAEKFQGIFFSRQIEFYPALVSRPSFCVSPPLSAKPCTHPSLDVNLSLPLLIYLHLSLYFPPLASYSFLPTPSALLLQQCRSRQRRREFLKRSQTST